MRPLFDVSGYAEAASSGASWTVAEVQIAIVPFAYPIQTWHTSHNAKP
jgi:hypothetical protein